VGFNPGLAPDLNPNREGRLAIKRMIDAPKTKKARRVASPEMLGDG